MALTKAQQKIVSDAAYRLGIPRNFALGVVDKESAGRAFWTIRGQKLPSIRIEGHYFYRLLPKALRAKAVELGLASRKVGAVKNPKNMAARYDLLDKMAELDLDAAYKSISIGIGQVMGEHAVRLGYIGVPGSPPPSVQMFQAACASFDAQVMQFLSFIATDKACLKAAQDFDYKAFTRIYNGRNGVKNGYHTELEQYVLSYEGGYKQSHGYENRIKALGYEDVRAFQKAHGLTVDGLVGPITRSVLVKEEAEAKKAKNKPNVLAGAATGGAVITVAAGAAGENTEAVTDTIETVITAVEAAKPIIEPAASVVLPALAVLPKVLIVVGCLVMIGVAGWILWRVYKEHLNAKETDV